MCVLFVLFLTTSVSSVVVYLLFPSTGRSPRRILKTMVITHSTSDIKETRWKLVRNGIAISGVIATFPSVNAKTALAMPTLNRLPYCSTVVARLEAVP